MANLLKAEGIGRPVGAKNWIETLERLHGKTLPPHKLGPKIMAPEEKAPEALDLFCHLISYHRNRRRISLTVTGLHGESAVRR